MAHNIERKQTMSLARLLYDIFYEGCTHYATAKLDKEGRLAYYPTEGVPTLEMIEQHLRGEIILGAYTVLPGNMVRWAAFDVDSRQDPEKAKELALRLCNFLESVAYIPEWSGNKGYHILLFFNRLVAAAEAKAVLELVRDALGLPKTGDPHVEVFPKQDKLTASNPLGNLLRLPLGLHPTTHNRTVFIDPFNGWQNGPEKHADKLLTWRVDIDEVKNLLQDQDPTAKIISILLPYWTDGQRHDMALYTAGYLASLGWTEDSVVDLVSELSEQAGDHTPEEKVDCVHDTFQRLFNGQTIKGFQGLAELLPNGVLRNLAETATHQTFSATLQIIDRIRLGKGASFQKVRISAKMIISYFKENGKLVKDENWVYWLDSQSRNLLSLGSNEWDLFTHTRFGINPIESFGKQVAESVRLFALEEAQLVAVYKRSYWDGERLLLNLGGAEVYILDGKTVEISLNGEGGVLFLNSEDPLKLPNLLEKEVLPLSPWSFLTDDLSFSAGENVNASPQQQRELLKAWILGVFFAQTMPTRPILTLLAPAGAGKTTTARRILRLLEGPGEDVLGVVPDKPDSIRSSLAAHKVLVLDNLEKTKAHWLTDTLNRVSTGSHIEIRTLYKTNDVLKIRPDVFVIITATEMPFSEETVYTRMLPIELAPLTSPRPEYQIQMHLIENLEALWKGLINDLNECVRELRNNTEVEVPNESRLADFTVFCSRVQNCSFLDGKELMEGLGSMVSRQRQVLQQSSPFIQNLEIWMRARPEDAAEWHNMSEIYTYLQKISTNSRTAWHWSSAQGLARHVSMLESQLVRHFGMSVRSVREQNREIKQYRFKRATLAV